MTIGKLLMCFTYFALSFNVSNFEIRNIGKHFVGKFMTVNSTFPSLNLDTPKTIFYYVMRL